LSLVMKGFAYDVEVVEKQMKVSPRNYMVFGLILILASTFFSLAGGAAFMKGYWVEAELPALGVVKLGTPLLFDIGVFLAVIGVTRMFFFSLKRAQ